MQTHIRQREIYEAARSEKKVRIDELAARFHVSSETIRRDIHTMESRGILKKVRGGAVISKAFLDGDSSYQVRIEDCKKEKDAIGARAAMMIRSGDTVAIDAGVTELSLVSALCDVENVTFFTHSFSIARVLCEKLNRREIGGRLILIGGTVVPGEFHAGGMETLLQYQPYRFDRFFTSVTSVNLDGCFMDQSEDGQITQSLIRASSETVLLCHSRKFGRASHYRCASFEDIDVWIIDDSEPLDENLLSAIRDAGGKLEIVTASEREAGREERLL